MPEEINQLMQGQENPDETAAVLSFATKLQEGMLPKASQTQEMTPTSQEQAKGENTPTKQEKAPQEPKESEEKGLLRFFLEKITGKDKEDKTENKDMQKDLKSFKKDIERTINDKFEKLTKTIKDAIEEE